MPYQSSRHLGGLAATALLAATLATPPAEAASQFNFTMVRSAGLPATCAPNARATVRVEAGFAEKLTLTVRGFREGTALVLFVIQKPNFPFGLGWYTGDVPVGEGGTVTKVFRSRFNAETFGLALDDVPAPVVHPATPTATRRSSRSTPSIWASGSIHPRTPPGTGVPPSRRRSTATTPLASRSSAPAISAT